jgi:hypothetical protein
MEDTLAHRYIDGSGALGRQVNLVFGQTVAYGKEIAADYILYAHPAIAGEERHEEDEGQERRAR